MTLTPSSSRAGTGIAETLLDAKGDLIAASAADTAARVAVGADGTHLLADANSAAGVIWAKDYGSPVYVSTCLYLHTGAFAGAAGGFVYETLYAVPFWVWRRQAFDRIGLHAGGGTATLVIRLGIYSDDGGPTTLLLDAGTIDGASAAALKTIVIAQTLDPGMYWLAAVAQVAGSVGALAAAKSGGGASHTPGLARADAGSSVSRSFARAAVAGALANLVPVAADFASSQESYAVLLRAT